MSIDNMLRNSFPANISAVVLTKNEEINLPVCLPHLSGWVDDLVVVDSGSTDQTVSLAEDYGARVYLHRMQDFVISKQRNWALSNCDIRSEWILFVDADEVITSSLKQEIDSKITSAPDEIVGFRLCFKFVFMGRWLKHVGTFPVWHDRLARRGRVRFVGIGGVRECFDPTCGKVGYIDEPYLHYGFNKGIAAWIRRHNRYSSDIAPYVNEARKNPIEWKAVANGSKDLRAHKRTLEALSARVLWFSPFLRFIYLYLFRKGFLDGVPGFLYAMMVAQYQFMIYLKVCELERRQNGLPV
jgi:glycosyltransferase involved in cell wall biosynthesis